MTGLRKRSTVKTGIGPRGRCHGGRQPSNDNSFHSPTVIPPSALDKPSIMKRYHRRRTCSHTSPRRSSTMVTLHDTRFVECRWWNDGWTVKAVVTRRSSASMIPAPGLPLSRRKPLSLGQRGGTASSEAGVASTAFTSLLDEAGVASTAFTSLLDEAGVASTAFTSLLDEAGVASTAFASLLDEAGVASTAYTSLLQQPSPHCPIEDTMLR